MDQRERLEAAATALGKSIKEALPVGVEFLLIVSTSGSGGWASYVSSVQRDDAMTMMAELIARSADSVGLPEIEGRVLHQIVTDRDAAWPELTDVGRQVWQRRAQQISALVRTLGSIYPNPRRN